MRAHGLPDFRDPPVEHNGVIQLRAPGSGIDHNSPQFRVGQPACRKLLPGGGPGLGPLLAVHMRARTSTLPRPIWMICAR